MFYAIIISLLIPYIRTTVAGYYGACSEEAMREALVKNGPIAIGFKVSREFLHYKKGIYSPLSTTKSTDKFDPFEVRVHWL